MNPVDRGLHTGPAVRSTQHRHDDRTAGGVVDVVQGATAVLAVAVALGRWTVEVVLRERRRGLAHLPTARVRMVHRVVLGPLGRVLAHPADTTLRLLASAADRVVPDLARAVLARVDVPALLAEFVDLDRVAALLDVDAVVARVDLSRVVDRLDLDEIVGRVDLDRAVDRVDVDRVLARTDLAGLARYVVEVIDLPGLLRTSTASVTDEVVRGVRDQGVDADRAVERFVDRLLHRTGRRTATGVADTAPPGAVP